MLIAGLGNPGREYARTPHNVGFLAVEHLASAHGAAWRRSLRLHGRVARVRHGERDLRLLEPQTYVNRSGQAVAAALRYYRRTPADLLVVVDDADLPLGRLRVRAQGGTGGHKGLESIIAVLNTNQFARIRIGVGRDQGKDLARYVLRPATGAAWEALSGAAALAAEAALAVADHGVARAMTTYNAAPDA
jgi:PTH1 family peptidyl-tRNA hydrolase